nr:histone H2A.Z-specific chaperone CHZ1-like [Nicotiana tomentosiformis]
MVVYTAPPQTEDISEKDSGRVSEALGIENVSHRSQQMWNISEGLVPESLRNEENAPNAAGSSDASDLFHEVQQALNQEKGLIQARKTEELKARYASKLAKAEKTKADADVFVAVYRADAEVAQSHIHARGFDLSEEITKARELEAEDEALASDDDDDDDDDGNDDDDGSKSGSQSGEEPDGEKTAPVDN